MTLWFIGVIALSWFYESVWNTFFLIGLNIIGIGMFIVLIYAVTHKGIFFSSGNPDSILRSNLIFNTIVVGLIFYLARPIIGVVLEAAFEEQVIYFHLKGVLIGGVLIGIALLQDLSRDQIHVQSELLAVKENYQMLVERLYKTVMIHDPEGCITYANPRQHKVLGYKEMLNKYGSDFVHPDELEMIEKKQTNIQQE